MFCFRQRKLISLSFIYYPGEGRRERGREVLLIYSLEPNLENLEHLPCTDCRDCLGSITFTRLKSETVTFSLVCPASIQIDCQ